MDPIRGRAAGVAAAILLLFSAQRPAAAADDGISLSIAAGPGSGEVTLSWSAGVAPYTVRRSSTPATLGSLAARLGTTSDTTWLDAPPDGAIFYYRVDGACPIVLGPEVCDGTDNDCDGTIDGPAADGSCQLPHTFAFCRDGACEVTGCEFGWGDCDRQSANGCERPLNTLDNCGSCGSVCDLPGATETCDQGYCQLVSCLDGFADCDAWPYNGCESDLRQVTYTCETAPFEGGRCGDTLCDPYCAPAETQAFLGVGARGGRWVHAATLECSSICGAPLFTRVTVQVPAGVDYDVYVYKACGALVGSSNEGPGQTETILLSQGDDPGASDSFDFWVEVRYVSGSSCQGWNLTLEATNCP